jgi:hypothetical protein
VRVLRVLGVDVGVARGAEAALHDLVQVRLGRAGSAGGRPAAAGLARAEQRPHAGEDERSGSRAQDTKSFHERRRLTRELRCWRDRRGRSRRAARGGQGAPKNWPRPWTPWSRGGARH